MRARGVSRVKVVAVAAVLIALLVIPTISSSINIYAIRIDNNNSNSNITNADTYNKEAIANKLLNTRISLPFIANVGQYDDSNIKYYADTFVGRLLIYDDNDNNNEIVYLLKDNVIKERLIITSTADNNNTASTDSIILKGNDPSITKVNYFKANKVLTDIPTYNSISFVSNSIELVLNAYNNNIEKVFVVKPYADVNDIVMEVDNNNSSSISIDNDGRLIIIINDNNNDGIAFTKPIAYQIIDGKKVNVDVSYRIIADNRYGFSVGNYDNRYDLIIDPLLDLSASTYIGGVNNDYALAIAIDSNNNNVFIAGYTLSNNFPIKDGYDNTFNGFADAFVAKFNNDLNQLLASTYIGGEDYNFAYDIAWAIAIDSNNNNVFIAGGTSSNNFPIVNGYDDSYNGFTDAFVVKFNNDLNQLLASTYIGGGGYDLARTIVIDSNNNNVFIAGYTSSNNFPIKDGYDNTFNGYVDAFVAKLTSIELTYNLNLYEGSNPSDGVINLGDSITAKATTDDSSITNVKFIWIDPSNNVARTNTVNIVNGEASDTYTPNQVGTWKVVAEFSNGTTVVKELQVPFSVVPESIIGALSVIGSSLAVLAVYRRKRKVNNN